MPASMTRGTIGLSRGEVTELEELAENLAGFSAEHPALLAFLDDVLKLFRRVIPLGVDLMAAHTDQA